MKTNPCSVFKKFCVLIFFIGLVSFISLFTSNVNGQGNPAADVCCINLCPNGSFCSACTLATVCQGQNITFHHNDWDPLAVPFLTHHVCPSGTTFWSIFSSCTGSSVGPLVATGTGNPFVLNTSLLPNPGTYWISAGCNAAEVCGAGVHPFVVNGPPVITGIVQNQNMCAGGGPVTLTVNATGNPTGYLWTPTSSINGSNTGATVSVQPGVTTTYTIVATNACGTGTSTADVTVYSAPNITVSPPYAYWCSGTNGSVTFNVSGGLTYSWSPTTDLSPSTGPTVVANPSTSQTYTVTGTDANGCSGITSVDVTVFSLPSVTITPSNPILSSCNQSITLSATAGLWSYQWSNGSTNPSTMVYQPGTYSVNVTDVNGCAGSASVIVSGSPDLSAPVLSGPRVQCGNGAPVYTITNFDPTVNSSYAWAAVDPSGTPVSITYPTTGNFQAAQIAWLSNQGGTITITLNLPTCTLQTTMLVYDCCDFPAGTYIDIYQQTASSTGFFTGGSHSFGSNLVIINGDFLIDQDITIYNSSNIQLGRMARIMIYPGKTLRLDNVHVSTPESETV